MRRFESNYLGEGSKDVPQFEQAEDLTTAEVESLGDENTPQGPPGLDLSGMQSSAAKWANLNWTYSSLYGFDPSQDITPNVDPNYTRYTDYESNRRLLEERKRNIQVLPGARSKPFMRGLKKVLGKFKRKDKFNLQTIPEDTAPEMNPYESLLPKDEQGYPAVYGIYEGSAIHGPVKEDEFYTSYDQIGTQYNENPGTRVQRTYSRLFGSANKLLNENQIKFLKEKGMTFKKKLGEGGFGEVWLVRQHLKEWSEGIKTTTDRMLACKILSLRNMELKQLPLKWAANAITEEAELYLELDHLNIVKRYEVTNLYDEGTAFSKPITVLMFMEVMEGDLLSLLHNYEYDDTDFYFRQQHCGWTQSPEKFTHLWSKQIVSGLRYLHENNISHMDLKPENILYSTHMESERIKYIFKLTDFGLSLKFKSNDRNVYSGEMGTIGYRAPEIDAGSVYETKPTDIYSLGVVMADSIAGDERDINDVIKAIRNYDNKVAQTYDISRSFASLLENMLDPYPEFRPDILEVYHNYWIKMLYQDPENVDSTRL